MYSKLVNVKNDAPRIGGRFYTHRFGTVDIIRSFDSVEEAHRAGFRKESMSWGHGWTIFGRPLGETHMEFAVVFWR